MPQQKAPTRMLFFYIMFCSIALFAAFISGAVYFQAHDIFLTENVGIANSLCFYSLLVCVSTLAICYVEIKNY